MTSSVRCRLKERQETPGRKGRDADGGKAKGWFARSAHMGTVTWLPVLRFPAGAHDILPTTRLFPPESHSRSTRRPWRCRSRAKPRAVPRARLGQCAGARRSSNCTHRQGLVLSLQQRPPGLGDGSREVHRCVFSEAPRTPL